MTVTREMLMAYADGQLDDVASRRVEQALEADPALAGELEAMGTLSARLKAHFAPVAEAPIPAEWTAMIAAAREEDAKVVSLDAARAKRAGVPRWGAGIAIAASLALGVMVGTQLVGGGPVAEKDGALIASAHLARALDTQLASAQDGDVRMLASFRRQSGGYCRVFAGEAASGIACREDGAWTLERLISGGKAQATQYRQAGSADAELMAAAQDMAAGEPLDAGQEAEARDKGWR